MDLKPKGPETACILLKAKNINRKKTGLPGRSRRQQLLALSEWD